MKVELIYDTDCPNVAKTRANLLQAFAAAHIEAEWTAQRALTEFLEHYHSERNHQGKGNVLLLPSKDTPQAALGSTLRCRQRLGGLLNYYCRAA